MSLHLFSVSLMIVFPLVENTMKDIRNSGLWQNENSLV